MREWTCMVIIFLLVTKVISRPEPRRFYYIGSIGERSIQMTLQFKAGKVFGNYFYNNDINLSTRVDGKYENDTLELVESDTTLSNLFLSISPLLIKLQASGLTKTVRQIAICKKLLITMK